MRDITLRDFRKVDLNLIPVFLVLMQERNLTRAAARLALGQPAVSAALARLREMLGDPLLIREARGMRPTRRAHELEARLRPLCEDLLLTVNRPAAFDPLKAQATFRLGMPDNHEYFLVPRLIERMQREAPSCRLGVRSVLHVNAIKLLDDGEIDLYCGRLGRTPAVVQREPLMEIGMLSIFDPRLIGGKRLTLQRFLEHPHVLMSARADFEGAVDAALAKIGHKRHVALSIDNFSTLGPVVSRLPVIATLPEHTARRMASEHGLAIAAPPVDLPKFWTSLAWMARSDGEPAHAWLRKTVREVALTLGAGGGPRRAARD